MITKNRWWCSHLQRWDRCSHPKFVLNIKTNDTAHTPRGYENVYEYLMKFCGGIRQVPKLVSKHFEGAEKGDMIGFYFRFETRAKVPVCWPRFVWFKFLASVKGGNKWSFLSACRDMGQMGKGDWWGLKVVSGQASKMESGSLLHLFLIFDWWLKCAMIHLVEFDVH